MWDRRKFLSRAGLGLLGSAGLALAKPDEPEDTLPDGSDTRGMITPRVEMAVRKGLAYLADRRNKQDGSFGTEAQGRINLQGNVAITSLAALAFMAGGNQPNRGPNGKIVTEALRYVLAQENRDGRTEGFLHNGNQRAHGPMYGHGFGTLFLGEVAGMVADPELRKETSTILRKAVALIVRSQNKDGGWRYNPGDRDADISVTVCQIMALRSARNAGIDVPAEVRQNCINYVKRCQNPRTGAFKYQIEEANNPTMPFARTAAGVSALYSAGIYKGEEVDKGLKYLMTQIPGGGALRPEPLLYFYGHYYAAQVMWTARGEYWQKWFPAIRDELLALQTSEGSWLDPVSSHYGTAMACIILQIPNNYLPILQK